MKQFFLLLFFSKSVLLTPEPISISGVTELHPDEPLEAISPGASLRINLAEFASGISIKSTGVQHSLDLLNDQIPKGSIRATLYRGKTQVILSDVGFSLSNDGAWLSLYSPSGVPTGIEFEKVVIESKVALINVEVYWKNYKH